MLKLGLVVVIPLLAGCSSIIEGTSQQISINTNPSGASCNLMRKGQSIAILASTPGTVKIDKTKDDITVLCDKPGFSQATYLNHSGAAGATFGNIVLGGGVGWAVDSATGADNKYDPVVNVTLTPAPITPAPIGPAPAAPASGPTS
jgi:hypothetical protein